MKIQTKTNNLNMLNTMKTIFTFLTLMVITIAQAQWSADTSVNTSVADSQTEVVQAKGTSTGETYVVFWKSVPEPTNYELRLQVLDVDGNKTLGPDGMLVSDQIPMSTFTVAMTTVIDINDNLYIGVTGTGSGNPAFVYKLDNNGQSLWTNNSVGNGFLVTVMPLASGEAIVGRLSNSGGVMQKYDATGTAVWPSEQPIGTGSGFKAPANFFELSEGEFVLVHHVLIGGVNSNLYAQRYGADGVPQWASDTQLSSRITLYNRIYTGIKGDDAVFMSYFGSNGSRFDAFVQRIDLDGTLPWGLNGSDFATDDLNYETNIDLAISNDDSFIYANSRYTDASQSMTGTYIQKFDATNGNRLFSDAAKEVFGITEDKVPAGKLYLQNNTPWFVVSSGNDNGVTPTEIEAVHLDHNGDFIWATETMPLATFAANKSRVQYTEPIAGQSVVVFIEDKGEGEKIYAQNLEDPNACALSITCPTTVVVVTDAGMCTASGINLGTASTSGCNGEVVSNDAPTVFPVGETVVTWTVDNGTSIETCVQLIIVEDTAAPTIICPQDAIVEVATGSQYILPDYFDTGAASAIDNCTDPVNITSQDPAPGTNLDVGTHQIILTAEDDHGNESICSFQLTVDEVLGTQTFANESILLYPNPTDGIVTLGNPSNFNLQLIEIYNVSGRMIKKIDIEGMGTSKSLFLSDLASGTYFILIKGEEGQLTKKILKN
ncbi:T9SS type A sorting domain-containing protein [Rasiella rasia]|uniref:T9SS type A sorting domain-containing protein n=1 Tax=Rasiella rasia TaxID=2744027 RepID=A0A6G6GNZ6_9FLAO|nr:T9SS type A sorting domain-containing protein [Rasiella rasia]QIE60268.1 T9SS type A sorting domain-containing protein [Rasiella rasia]